MLYLNCIVKHVVLSTTVAISSKQVLHSTVSITYYNNSPFSEFSSCWRLVLNLDAKARLRAKSGLAARKLKEIDGFFIPNQMFYS